MKKNNCLYSILLSLIMFISSCDVQSENSESHSVNNSDSISNEQFSDVISSDIIHNSSDITDKPSEDSSNELSDVSSEPAVTAPSVDEPTPPVEPLRNKYIDFEDETIHIGGDETNSEAYKIADFKSIKTGTATSSNDKTIKYVYNPQSSITAFATTTTIYDMDVEKFKASNEYSKGFTSILYTPDFYFAHTTADSNYFEYVLTLENGKYVVTDAYEDGYATIPLDGVILATPKDNIIDINIGDEFTFSTEVNAYQYGIVNQDNARLTFNKINEFRAENDVVLFDRRFGHHTKTNQYGSEIYVQYDFNKDAFVVEGFRGYLKKAGDLFEDHANSGGYIPKYGFVISAQSEYPLFDYYKQDRKFKIGDTVTFENYSFNYQLQNKTFSKYSTLNPASRPDNNICIYTYGSDRLDQYGKTNQPLWGSLELAVSKVMDYDVITFVDRDVCCPENGYIISCNGEIAEELRKYVQVGTLVKVTDNSIIINNDIGLKEMTNIENYLNTLLSRNTLGKANLYDYNYDILDKSIEKLIGIQDAMSLLLEEINNSTDESYIYGNEVLIKQLYYDSINIYKEGYCASTESNYVEARAAWFTDLSISSLEDVKRALQHYKNANINLIYIQVYDGATNFQSDLVPYDPKFSGNFGEYGQNNFLKAFVSEAHKLEMEVHGWTTNFYAGNYGETNIIFDTHPEWQQKYYDGNVNSTDEMTEQYLLYLDQTNPEVHQFLVDFYNELLDENDLDGLHLDYIRYAAGNDVGHKDSVYCPIGVGQKLYAKNCLNRTTGYTDYAMADFLKEYGYAPETNMKELIKDVKVYNQWTEYRANKVTQFVEKIHNEVMVGRDIPLSMAIVPEIEHAYLNKMQDWPTWIENGWIDILSGMYYSKQASQIKVTTEEVKQTLIENDLLLYQYPGILACVYYELDNINNIYYLEAAKNTIGMGSAFFEAQSIFSNHRSIYSDSNYDVEALLKMGSYRNEAVLPHDKLDKVLKAFIDDISQKCENIYIPYNAMNETQKEELITLLNSFNNEDPNELLNQLNALKDNLDMYASGAAKERISEYIDIMIEICNIRIK